MTAPSSTVARTVDHLESLIAEGEHYRHLAEPTKKASALYDDLKGSGRYSQPQWRLIQAWLDVGNAAAHGDFDKFEASDVVRMLEEVRRFSARELGARG